MSRRNKLMLVLVLAWFIPAISTAVYQPVGIIKGLLSQAITTVFSSTFDTATPAGGDSPTEADDRMREIKAAVQERENVDHYWPLTGTEVSDAFTGEHRKITYFSTIADPTQVAGKAHLYMKSDELYYQDDSNTTLQMTAGGDLKSSAGLVVDGASTLTGAITASSTLDVVGDLDPTSFIATNGGFIDEDTMATDSAVKAPSQQSVKAYVDNTNPVYAPTVYTGQQSHTEPNGRITKQGQRLNVVTGSDTAVNFSVAFPTAITRVVFNWVGASGLPAQSTNVVLRSESAATIEFRAVTEVCTVDWVAIGY